VIRAVPDDLDPAVVAGIDERLDGVERGHGVHVPWAIESGSRAWGFPSPDSDYDGRFFYVRPVDAYLGPWPPRDVIETPLDKVFDVNGWDLRKSVALLVKGNATVVEWLRSPIVYRGDPDFRDGLLALADRVADPALVGRHYLHVCRQQWLDQAGHVSLKKVFYALRPALALRWLREHPGSSTPPMRLQDLLAAVEPPAGVAGATADLVAAKAVTREAGTGVVPDVLRRFVEDELARGASYDEQGGAHHAPERLAAVRADASAWFRSAVERWGGTR
jgi:predicted nucleotidyltransferase